jgi:signal transduction histidine kinase
MKGWRRDTLFTRLFLLMLAALLGSHLVAWLVVTRVVLPMGRPTAAQQMGPPAGQPPPLPPLGSLPPTPGLPSSIPGPGGPGLPPLALLVDYGIRILLIGAAAAWGARWLARPVKQMVQAARTLSDGVARGEAPPPLDERQGAAEVRDASRVFNQMSGQLAEAFRSRGLLMAAISHDLRTPLTRMRIRLESLLPDPRAQRCVEDIREMNGLVDSAISVFRAEDGADEALQATDVLALVQSLADDLAETGQPVALQGHSLVALVRPVALGRAVGNLIGNALRHGGSAEVTVLSLGGPRILIDDRGPGIPDAQLQRVLEPFYRLDPSRNRETGGSGLGLHIARSLLHGQGATLSLSNRPTGGLRVEIRLQAAPAR